VAAISRSESDTRAKLIDPALHARGWTEDLIKREETAGAVELIGATPRKRARGRVDYTLRIKSGSGAQPVAVALIEAKAEHLPPAHGLEQGKGYASARRLNVPFVFASNGHQFVGYDRFSGLTSEPRVMAAFPSPAELRARYEQGLGFSLDDPAARPLSQPYPRGEATRRYYHDAAIRAVFEKLARCERQGEPTRALLTLATGAGKTFIAVNLLARIAVAGQLRRALFVCDRDELRAQALGALNLEFGSDAAPVTGSNPQKNARVLVATYQTLDVESDEADASFLVRHYPGNYFSHIVIDECHRSAWGRWSQVLTRNPGAVQIGLTATPRQGIGGQGHEAEADARITADNIAYFGEPVYEYDMSQGMEDGFLAACEIVRRDIFLEAHEQSERQTGVAQADLERKRLVDARTGEQLGIAEARAFYSATSFEERLILPDRVREMTADLFACLLRTGGPEQKSIIFCSSDHHADDVASAMNNLYAGWCCETGATARLPYAFKCTAASGGAYLSEFKGSTSRYFVATTVDLLTTGVDVPPCRNVVFFKYVRSPIAFYQMVGRGTRLDPATGKLMFRVYDYTDATRLFGEDFRSRIAAPRREAADSTAPEDRERTILVEGFDVRVTDAGRYIVTMVDGRAMPITVEAYKENLAARLVAEAPTLGEFRRRWIVPAERHDLLDGLPDGGRSAALVRSLEEMQDYDLYDVLAELGYGLAPHTRQSRAGAFEYKHEQWLNNLPRNTAAALRALAGQFARSGTDGLENPRIFQTPEVVRAGGLAALRAIGEPAGVVLETKERLFAA
jgi:type I restriction enzyme R subunit